MTVMNSLLPHQPVTGRVTALLEPVAAPGRRSAATLVDFGAESFPAASRFEKDDLTTEFRMPRQPLLARHVVVILMFVANCWVAAGMLEQSAAAVMAPPEEPARRVLLLMMPRDCSTAATPVKYLQGTKGAHGG